jgi:hypothetical protein
MKIKTFLSVVTLSLFAAVATAQTAIPEGYTKATITLDNGTAISGYIKDNIKKSSSVTFIDETGNNKKVYEGRNINNLATAAGNFICVNGDFFKTISAGKLNFVQKQSNSSANASYNGAEAVFNSGTEGKIGDYFIYADKKLKLLNKKTIDAFINTDLIACAEAVEKAKTINGDMAKLQQAVEIYNNYSNN